MQMQLYWPNWWKLYPHWVRSEETYGNLFVYTFTVFSFGPFQCKWYGKV